MNEEKKGKIKKPSFHLQDSVSKMNLSCSVRVLTYTQMYKDTHKQGRCSFIAFFRNCNKSFHCIFHLYLIESNATLYCMESIKLIGVQIFISK